MSNYKHGNHVKGKRTSEYISWNTMKQRCYNPKNKKFKDYGARGIEVCERWLHDFSNFLSDMGAKPVGDYSIDRINVDGDYEPGNCKWSTRSEQEFHKRLSNKNKSGYTGVHFRKDKNKWEAHITLNKKRVHLGYFIDKELANEARKLAEYEYLEKSS